MLNDLPALKNAALCDVGGIRNTFDGHDKSSHIKASHVVVDDVNRDELWYEPVCGLIKPNDRIIASLATPRQTPSPARQLEIVL